MKTGRRIGLGKGGRQMKETATGMAAAANVPAILWPSRPASKEGAAPPPVTVGSRERGHGQGTIGRPAGSGQAERRGRIGGTPVKYGDPPNLAAHATLLHMEIRKGARN